MNPVSTFVMKHFPHYVTLDDLIVLGFSTEEEQYIREGKKLFYKVKVKPPFATDSFVVTFKLRSIAAPREGTLYREESGAGIHSFLSTLHSYMGRVDVEEYFCCKYYWGSLLYTYVPAVIILDILAALFPPSRFFIPIFLFLIFLNFSMLTLASQIIKIPYLLTYEEYTKQADDE